MKTSGYFLMIALAILWISSAQAKDKKPPKAEKYWHETGLRLGTDLTRPFQTHWVKGKRWGGEFFADFELIPDVFVVGEAGWEKFDMNHPHVNYTSNGAYMRLGADYNLLHVPDEKNDKSTLFFGLRYGFGSSAQTVNSYQINNYWGTYDGNFNKQNYATHWGELVFGMKTEILKNIYLGWSVRAKFKLGQGGDDMPPAYFAAGYGTNDAKMNFDFNYSLMYSLPFNLGKRHSKKEKAAQEAALKEISPKITSKKKNN